MAVISCGPRRLIRRRRLPSRRIICLLLIGTALPSSAPRSQDRSQARSMVITPYGIVAAESPLAAEAGVMMLAHGGNAVDAAVSANAVMGVVAPMMNGLGGDLFALVYVAKTGKVYGLNASGWSPQKLTITFMKQRGMKAMPIRGIDSVTVPGVVGGWSKLLARFGRKGFPEVLAPAIEYAKTGFPVTELVATAWLANQTVLRMNSNAARTYLPGGKAPATGTIFRNPDLAWSLEQIAEHGRDAFYRGKIAHRIITLCLRHGGVMTMDDLVGFSSEWVKPISTTYRDWTVYELPPNSQGIATLEMLNIMDRFPLPRFGHNSAKSLHVMIEAKKLAYADLLRYVGDPRFAKIPVSELLSKAYARRRAERVDLTKANCDVGPGYRSTPIGDTTYLAVVDREGNMVSLIQSNGATFGSGLVAAGTGFVLQDRGALFSLNPASPDSLAGHKRPLHTIIPAFMAKDNLRVAFGIMGGFNQPQAQAQFVSNIVDFGMNIQAALEAPRFTQPNFHGCRLQIEARVSVDIRKELEHMGHHLEVRGDYSTQMGGGQAVLRNFATKVNFGASSPRKDGEAICEPLPMEVAHSGGH